MFTVWKTIKLGTYKNVSVLKKALDSAGCRVSNGVNDLLDKLSFIPTAEETELDLIIASVADLGFEENARYDDICAKALSLGFQLCPEEVGPQLRLQYDDQPKNEWLHIAMKAIINSDGDHGIFSVGYCLGWLWLNWASGGPNSFSSPGARFVFVLPRKLS